MFENIQSICVIAALLFLTWTILPTTAARLAVLRAAKSPNACESEHEKLLAQRLWSIASDLRAPRDLKSTPFASCGPEIRELPVEKIASEDGPMALCDVGKLAKGGSFFRSVDGSVLVKLVDSAEAQKLLEWGEHAMAGMSDYPGGCNGFKKTLLVETTLNLRIDGLTYIVMPNLTYSLTVASPENWEVVAVYDAKPLPNLGKGLVNLFKDVTAGWGVDLPRLGEWLGWEQVQGSMLCDLQFLGKHVVDFSLFVHVLRRKGDDDHVPAILGPSKGCIMEPGRSLLVCFSVLDYLTPFSWVRQIESQARIEKFHDYAGKSLKAFNCLRNVDQLGCENYKALANISEAMEVSKNMAKAVFIGSTAFREAYTCAHETPSLQYTTYWRTTVGKHPAIFLGEVRDVPVNGTMVVKTVKWITDSSKSSSWLQAIASPQVAYLVGEQFEANMEVAYSKSELRRDSARMPKLYDSAFKSCIQTVREFATESYLTSISQTDMLNVLWEDESERVIVVRGLPQSYIPGTSYEHKDTVQAGRLRDCFLKTHYMRCDPEEKSGVYFNYKQHFGALEVMVMSAREQSDDMNVYLEALQTRHEILAEEDVRPAVIAHRVL